MTETHQSKFRSTRALKQSITQFFEQTTLHGYKYLVDPKRDNFLERSAWVVVVFVALVFAVYITWLGWSDFNDYPTFTTLYSQKYPIWEVNFPGVSICSINRISRRAAVAYVDKLATKDPSINVSWTLDNIRLLGALNDHLNPSDRDFFQFQELLDRLDPDESLGVNDIRKTMEMLAPKCSDLLIKCRWEDKDIDCSKQLMSRRTSVGYCCCFNYVRTKKTLSEDDNVDPLRAYRPGMDKGLVVVLNTSTDDYFYSILSTTGYTVGIHNPRNFPDVTNGNFRQFVIPNNTEAFLKLDVETVKTSTDVLRYSVDKRGCLFSFESWEQFGGHYSYADCFLRCKIYSYLYLCDCIPYVLPTNFPGFGESIQNATRCNLTHLRCLERYSTTLITPKPRKPIQGLEKELGDSLDCPDCYPLCSLNRYLVQASYSELAREEITADSWGFIFCSTQLPEYKSTGNLGCRCLRHRKGVITDNNTNVSILRVYYPLVATLLYKSGVVYSWHEIISYFGGLLSLCIGFSTISFMELIYFGTVRLYQNCVGHRQTKNKVNQKHPTYKGMEIILVKEFAHLRK